MTRALGMHGVYCTQPLGQYHISLSFLLNNNYIKYNLSQALVGDLALFLRQLCLGTRLSIYMQL